jgi:2-dehydropantoate 2-reductase
MKVCIVGAGAIGSFFGTRLAAAARAEVSALARGATLEALRRQGWRLQRQGGTTLRGPVQASDDARELGTQDLVVVAVKGPALPPLASSIGPLLGADTIVLAAMNGVPWWFGEGMPALGSAPLESVDPGGRTAAAIEHRRVVGCVVHASVSVTEPGVACHLIGQGLTIGEPDGVHSERLGHLAELLGHAGFDVTCSPRIRHDVWYKLWGNMTANPVSAITGATMDKVLEDDLVRNFCSMAMTEAAAIGARIGCAVEQNPEDRHAITRKLGAFKTSMLQDVEAARPIELDSIVAAAREIGHRVGVPTPTIDALFGLTRLFARVHGLYPRA